MKKPESQIYKSYNTRNLDHNYQLRYYLSEEQLHEIKVVGQVLPFRANNYIVENLIEWENIPNDPIFRLVFPHKEMLQPKDFEEMSKLVKNNASSTEINDLAYRIQQKLNPHPAGQATSNIPDLYGTELTGLQHKYSNTVLFFPGKSQTCHAYCSFCFRWPQFVRSPDHRFAMNETDLLVSYLRKHSEVTDLLITGGDPMIMKTRVLEQYINPILEAGLPSLKNIRIGTKVIGFWPYRVFSENEDSKSLMRLFQKIKEKNIHLTLMCHFNHPKELETLIAQKAIKKLISLGITIRTQSPIVRHINNDSAIWKSMWEKQVEMGCIPYYMFILRDTGSHEYFSVPIAEALEVFIKANQNISGLCKTVRGPVMSTYFGKILVNGISTILGKKVFILSFLQARNSNWVNKPFFANFNSQATWINELVPAFSKSKSFNKEYFESVFSQDVKQIKNTI